LLEGERQPPWLGNDAAPAEANRNRWEGVVQEQATSSNTVSPHFLQYQFLVFQSAIFAAQRPADCVRRDSQLPSGQSGQSGEPETGAVKAVATALFLSPWLLPALRRIMAREHSQPAPLRDHVIRQNRQSLAEIHRIPANDPCI
jgi:hypothetical protein